MKVEMLISAMASDGVTEVIIYQYYLIIHSIILRLLSHPL